MIKPIILTVLTAISGCVMDSFDDRLKIANNSTIPIYYTVEFGIKDTNIIANSPQVDQYWDAESEKMLTLPDSILKSLRYRDFVKSHHQMGKSYLEPKDTTTFRLTNINWEQMVRDSGGIQVFFFNSDTVELKDWAEVKKEYKVLQRKKVTLEELKKINWMITYP